MGNQQKRMFEIPSNQEHFFQMEMDDEEVDHDFGLQTTKLGGQMNPKKKRFLAMILAR